jgi:seryl-tRNA synthetase
LTEIQTKTVCGIIKDNARNEARVEQIVRKWIPTKEQLLEGVNERIKEMDAQISNGLSADLDKRCNEMQHQVTKLNKTLEQYESKMAELHLESNKIMAPEQ